MGVVLDSSIIIAAERRRDTVAKLLTQVLARTGDQEAVLSSIGLVELSHGIYRAKTAEVRTQRENFINELLSDIPVYPFTKELALLAGKLDGEQQSQGIIIPFADLLIGATALWLGYSVVTGNLRHFQKIPGLSVLQI
jgi:predicted nucleic acid-binding protein